MTKQDKVAKVMHEWKAGTLTSNGKVVEDYDQAVAIALSEAGLSKYDEGGSIEKENALMVANNNKQIAHHTEEMEQALKDTDYVPAWVVAKVNRSASDLSDATHYLEGQEEDKYEKGGEFENADDFIENVKEMHESIDYVVLKDGTKVNGYDIMREGGEMNEYSKGGNVIERRYVNKDEDYETRYAKNRPSRMGYKDERKFEGGGEMGEFAYGSTETLKVELANNLRDLQGMNKVMRNNDMPKSYVGDAMRLQARNEDLVKELKHRGVNINSILYKEYDKFAVGGEIGNTVSFKGDYGTPRSGVIKEKRGSSYIVGTDDGDRLVDSYEVISFSETPIAKKKRFGFFEGGGSIESSLSILKKETNEYSMNKYGEPIDEETFMVSGIKKDGENVSFRFIVAETVSGKDIKLTPSQIFDVDRDEKFAGGGEIENKIEKLKKVVSSKMLPESVKAKAQAEIDKLEKELHESKETKAEEKAEHEAGGYEYKEKVGVSKIKILWAEGDNSKYDKFPKEYSSWSLANKAVIPVYKDTVDDEGYNKLKFEVTFKDGETYDGRLDVSEKEDNPIKSNNAIGQHIKDYLDYMSSEKSASSEDDKKEIKEWLEKYDLGLDTKEENKMTSGSEEKDYIEAKTKALEKSLKDKTISETQRKRDEKELALFKGAEANKPTTTSKKEVVGYAIVDPISGEIVVSKKTIRQLIEASKKLEKTKGFEDMGDLAYEIIKKDDKNVLGDKIESVDIKSLPINKKPTTRKAPVKKAVVKKAEIKKEIETPAKPKADHKKLVAKLKAKKGATPSNEPSKGHKRSESSDRKRSALPLGKRVSADGNVYYERRLNRADINKEDKFKDGGEIDKNSSSWGLNLNW